MRVRKQYEAGLALALKAVGGPKALADCLGILPSAVTQWARVPPDRVLDVEAATGITRYVLRSDLYPPPGHKRHAPAPEPAQ